MASPESSAEVHKAAQAPEEPYPSESYAWYVVVVLMIVYVFSFVDRQILNLLAPAIKSDWNLTDKHLGYLMGPFFALFYTLFGIPIGRLADMRSRRGLIAAGLAIWSFMTAACGLAKTYWQMAFFRLGVGVGEATLSPSAYSLITDYFRPNRLALAISVYGAGIYLGSGLAFVLGGAVYSFAAGGDFNWPIVGQLRPWQAAFLMLGIPGLLFTLALLTVKEPTRRGLKKKQAGKEEPVSLREVFQYVQINWRTVLAHNVGFALLSFIAYGSTSWMSAFFLRVHDWPLQTTGYRYGAAIMIFGTGGIVFGGWLAGWLSHKGYTDSKMRAGFIASALHLPFGFLFPLMPNGWLAILVLCPAIFTVAMPFGVAPAAIQEMMPNRMRAQASAVYLFIVNAIGLGLGPIAVAYLTEDVFRDEQMVGYSMIIVSTAAGIVATGLLYYGMGLFRESIENLKKWQESGGV
jgi:MFS family permease